ncbi:MAG: NAD-dependent epimerase/dehydratase family protein [Bacteroidota bacterium]
MNTPIKVAVTGASGHVGVNLVNKLIKLGFDVKVLIFSSTIGLDDSRISKVVGSLLDKSVLVDLCKDVDVVIHLAAIISIGSESQELLNSINVDGTKNILNVARNAGVKKFIHFSSIHALVHEPLEIPMDETRELAVNSKLMYEQTKSIAEEWVLKQNTHDFEVVVLNPTSIIGPVDNKPSLMGEFMISVYKHTIPGVVPGGYDWVDVRDIVDAAIAAIEKGRGGERYILSGHWLSIKSFADMFVDCSDKRNYLPVIPLWLTKIGVPFIMLYSKITKSKPLYTFESLEILQSGNKYISSSKAKSVLGFKSRPLEQTLSDTYKWFKENDYI